MLSVAINFVQTYRSQLAIQKLRENVTPTATVLRDGKWQEVHRVKVVPGDMVRLCAGDLVPADGLLLESRDLYVQQAALTGESMPDRKNMQHRPCAEAGDSDSADFVFLGTSVVSGTGTARDFCDGRKPRLGRLRSDWRAPGGNGVRAQLRQFGC